VYPYRHLARWAQFTARPDQEWRDENCGGTGWAMTPLGFAFGETARSASTRGVLNDALSIYFGDATLASAFVARWCAGYEVETGGAFFQVREE
jgi:hypothetical protein